MVVRPVTKDIEIIGCENIAGNPTGLNPADTDR